MKRIKTKSSLPKMPHFYGTSETCCSGYICTVTPVAARFVTNEVVTNLADIALFFLLLLIWISVHVILYVLLVCVCVCVCVGVCVCVCVCVCLPACLRAFYALSTRTFIGRRKHNSYSKVSKTFFNFFYAQSTRTVISG